MISQSIQDIYASRQTSKILTGELSSVEIFNKNISTEDGIKTLKIPCGIIFYGGIKIYIPAKEMNIERDSVNEIHTIMKTMAGATIDFIITEIIDKNTDDDKVDDSEIMAVASRRKAMELRYNLELKKHKVGDKIPVRIVGIGRTTAYVEVYGIEVQLPKEEIEWGFVTDLRNIIQIGDIKKALIQEIDTDNRKIKISIKRASPDPYMSNIKKVTRGACYTAVVTGTEKFGVFFELKDLKGVSALTNYPNWNDFHPAVGDICLIKINRISEKDRKIDASLKRVIRKA
jgi:small subunit ribosomal protein S1